MKRYLSRPLALCLILCASGAIVAASAEEKPKPPEDAKAQAEAPKQGAGPILKIDKLVVDAGEVLRGQPALAVFELRNTGDQVLTILDARPGCGCTVASFDKTIAPGQTGKVTASVKTENFRGPIEKSITVTSSDVSNAMVSLRVKANVVGSVEILPGAYLAFPRPPLMEYTGKLVIRKDKTESGELKITDATASVPWVSVKARKVTAPEQDSPSAPAALPGDWILEAGLSNEAPAQTGPQQITFKTGLMREPQVTVPLSISFAQAMQSDPASLVMIVPQGTPGAAGTFKVALRPGLGKEPVTATAAPDVFDVKLEPDGERRYRASVVWKAAGETPQRYGNVMIATGKETLTVPVRVIEKPATLGAAVTAPDKPGPGPTGAAAPSPTTATP